jgi:hypothetical protein
MIVVASRQRDQLKEKDEYRIIVDSRRTPGHDVNEAPFCPLLMIKGR